MIPRNEAKLKETRKRKIKRTTRTRGKIKHKCTFKLVGLVVFMFLGFVFTEYARAFCSANYDFLLLTVQWPKEATTWEKIWGKKKEKEIIHIKSDLLFYEDELLEVHFYPYFDGIELIIVNKADYSLEILWDKCSYIDQYNFSHRVIHTGIKYIKREEPQSPSIVAPKGRLLDTIFPADYILFSSEGTWGKMPLFPRKQSKNETVKDFKNFAQSFIGKTFGVLLSLRIKNITKNYTFTFKITRVQFE